MAIDRVRLNIARTKDEQTRVAKLPKADKGSQAIADAARKRQTNNHPGRS